MTTDEALYWGQQTLMTVLSLAGPMMLTALVVGTLISLVQSMTQVQEITLVFVPKIIAVFFMAMLLGGWMLQEAVTFGTQCFEAAAEWRH